MKSEPVGPLSQLVVGDELRTVVRRTHRTMVNAHAFGEGPRAPAVHARHQHGDNVDATAFERPVAADLLIAGATEQLTRTRHVILAAEAVIVGDAVFAERTAREAELRVAGELAEQELEVIGDKRQIRVETSHDIEGQVPDGFEAGVEGGDLPGEIADLAGR